MSSRRDERKARTRAAVLASARECFAIDGPAATSTQRVSGAAGVSHGTLFLHFPSREALIDAVVADFAADFESRLPPLASSLADEFDAQLHLVAAEEGLHAQLLREEFALTASSRSRLRDLSERLRGRIVASYESERDRGDSRALSSRLFATTWIALLEDLMRRNEGSPVLRSKGPEIRRHCLDLAAL